VEHEWYWDMLALAWYDMTVVECIHYRRYLLREEEGSGINWRKKSLCCVVLLCEQILQRHNTVNCFCSHRMLESVWVGRKTWSICVRSTTVPLPHPYEEQTPHSPTARYSNPLVLHNLVSFTSFYLFSSLLALYLQRRLLFSFPSAGDFLFLFFSLVFHFSLAGFVGQGWVVFCSSFFLCVSRFLGGGFCGVCLPDTS